MKFSQSSKLYADAAAAAHFCQSHIPANSESSFSLVGGAKYTKKKNKKKMAVAEATNWNFLFPSPGFLFFFCCILLVCMYALYVFLYLWNFFNLELKFAFFG